MQLAESDKFAMFDQTLAFFNETKTLRRSALQGNFPPAV